MANLDDRCRLHFETDAFEIDYLSTWPIALEIQAYLLRGEPEVRVIVDDHVGPDMRPLPCGRLFVA